MSFSGFKQYLIDEEKTVFFTFGKMNPPNASHGIVLEALSKKATNNPYRVYSTTLQESANNPLKTVTSSLVIFSLNTVEIKV